MEISHFTGKVKTGVKWSVLNLAAKKSLTLISSVILARLLGPSDFGIFGIASIFLGFSQVFVDGGVGYAIMRSKNIDSNFLSNVLFINCFIGIVIFFVFFSSSNLISDFYGLSDLNEIIKILSIVIIIDIFTVVPKNLNLKKLKFKEGTYIDIVSSALAGVIGIYLAINGYGVWSLVYQLIIVSVVNSILHNYVAKVTYTFAINFNEMKKVFHLSKEVFLNSILSHIFNNINGLVIGKLFPLTQLGFFNRAKKFSSIIQNSIIQTTQNSIFPVFCNISDNKHLEQLVDKVVKNLSSFGMPIIMFFAASSENIILLLLSEKWAESIPLLRLLLFASLLYVPQMVFINALKARNQKLYFKSEIISKLIKIVFLIFSIQFGVIGIIVGVIVQTLIMTFLSAHFFNSSLNQYNLLKSLNSCILPFSFSLIVFLFYYFLESFLKFGALIELLIFNVSFIPLFYFFLKKSNINIKSLIS